MSESTRRQSLQKERSFDSSNGRPTKYFKLDRTYSDVVEDELYAPQGDSSSSGSTSAPQPALNRSSQPRTERIQNTYPQLFHNSGTQNADNAQNSTRYWPGMESSIRFDREQRGDQSGKTQVIADRKQKVQQQPEQSTVSPKEAFLDYNDNAKVHENNGSVFEYSDLRSNARERQTTTESESKSANFPTISSQRNFGHMNTPKTITPVRANKKLSPKPVAPGYLANNGARQSPAGPNRAQASDNAAANAKIRALYKEESTNSNASNNSELQSPQSYAESDAEYLPQDASQRSQLSSSPNYICSECQESFDRESALELHSRIHAVPPSAMPHPPSSGSAHAASRQKAREKHDEDDEDEDDPEADVAHNDKSRSTKLAGGPHRCDWIVPSTGQVCGTVFSRPYDLVRHQDTIHRAKKLEFRCEICIAQGIQKIFSRNDALVRHTRHVHKKDLPKK